MKNVLIFFLSIISCLANAQGSNVIFIGKVDSIQSAILGETRKVLVHVPNGGDGLYSKKRYPVAYVLDGDAHFASVVGIVQQLSSVNGNTIVPEMIVVSIRNTDRTRDMTPTQLGVEDPMMEGALSRKTGGGGAFLSFIEQELMPHVDSLYPTEPYKMLIGHSFGGLVVMNALVTRLKLFNAYICVDPSMWYDRMNFLKATKKALAAQKYGGITMYLGIANTMNEGLTLEKVVSDTSLASRHIRSIIDLDKFLKAHPQTGLRYASKFYPDDTHSSAPLITEYDGLRFIFDFYRLRINDSDFTHNTGALPDKLVKHYANVSRQMGYKVMPPEEMVNSMGYEAMQRKHMVTAGSLFRLNTINYPTSWNVFDSYGDYFLAKNDKVNAIAQFEKTISLKDNEETKKKLEALKNSQK